MNQAYIINEVRTPIGNFRGTLTSVQADDMAAFVLRELHRTWLGYAVIIEKC